MPIPLIVMAVIEIAAAAAARAALRQLVKEAAKKAAAEAAKKLATEAAKKAAAEAAKKAAAEAGKKAAAEAAKKMAPKAIPKATPKANTGPKPHNGKKNKPGPCDHLRLGSGKGDYRGGAHNKTSKPANDGKDSHHAPADASSPLKKKDGPAIQMKPSDHDRTSSNGKTAGSAQYRDMIAQLISKGQWDKALAIEIKDIRRVAKEVGEPEKYNEAIKEMREYYKCLKKNNLLQ